MADESIKVGGKEVKVWRQGGYWTCKFGGKTYQAWSKGGLQRQIAAVKPDSFQSNRKWWML